MFYMLAYDPFIYLFIGNLAACGILVPQPGIEPRAAAVKVLSPNHWTTTEVPTWRTLHVVPFISVQSLSCVRLFVTP